MIGQDVVHSESVPVLMRKDIAKGSRVVCRVAEQRRVIRIDDHVTVVWKEVVGQRVAAGLAVNRVSRNSDVTAAADGARGGRERRAVVARFVNV